MQSDNDTAQWLLTVVAMFLTLVIIWTARPSMERVRTIATQVRTIATQTKEGGLAADAPLRTLNSAQWQQACQKCWEPIKVGDRVSQICERLVPPTLR